MTANDDREQLHITLSSIGDAVISTDADGRVTFLNRAAETLTGWPQAEAIGRPLAEVYRVVDEPAGETLLARDGSRVAIQDSVAPMRASNGAVAGTVVIFRDASEGQRADEIRAQLAAIVEFSEDAIVSKTLD